MDKSVLSEALYVQQKSLLRSLEQCAEDLRACDGLGLINCYRSGMREIIERFGHYQELVDRLALVPLTQGGTEDQKRYDTLCGDVEKSSALFHSITFQWRKESVEDLNVDRLFRYIESLHDVLNAHFATQAEHMPDLFRHHMKAEDLMQRRFL